MKIIESITIRYFRSVYTLVIGKCGDITVVTGKNDVGKSNILKALNLFFCQQSDYMHSFDFSEDYSLKRKEEVRVETIKGQQFISISVRFLRGDRMQNSLPPSFSVTKRWDMHSSECKTTSDVQQRMIQYAQKNGIKYSEKTTSTFLSTFLNKIKYIYVPAIKDERVFNETLNILQQSLFDSKNQKILDAPIGEANKAIQEIVGELQTDFRASTGIQNYVELPNTLNYTNGLLQVNTSIDGGSVTIDKRGDGIRTHYIPKILNYVASKSKYIYIWGFEEPENSLEFNMARKMSDDFYNVYRKNSQIFVTTHSPAFIDLGNKENCSGYRCYIKELSTAITDFKNEKDEELLSEELGYAYILQRQFDEYKAQKTELEQMNVLVNDLKKELQNSRRPVVLTEGKTDATILKTAWGKLKGENCPFDIKDCSLVDSEDLAGCNILKTILQGVRSDSEKVIIGLFDNDDAGQKAYALDKNYKEVAGQDYKVNKSKKGYALLLPASTPEHKAIEKGKNLSIEFMFSLENLEKKVNGKGLKIEMPKVEKTVNGYQVEESAVDEKYWYLGRIDKKTKNDFASLIVPTFEKEAFENFGPLFDMILDIISQQ